MTSPRVPLAAALLGLSLGLAGCGQTVVTADSKQGSFNIIEGSVNDICDRILDPNYKPRGARDLGSDSDRMGMAMLSFSKSVEGTPAADEAKGLSNDMVELEKMVAARAPIEKQRAAAKALKERLAAAKAKF